MREIRELNSVIMTEKNYEWAINTLNKVTFIKNQWKANENNTSAISPIDLLKIKDWYYPPLGKMQGIESHCKH